MASCGPSNAQTQMKSHVLRDASLQRENALTGGPQRAGFRSGRPDTAAAEFAQFNAAPLHKQAQFDFGAPQSGLPGPLGLQRSGPPQLRADPGNYPTALAHTSRAETTYRDHALSSTAGGAALGHDWSREFANLRVSDPREATPELAYARPAYQPQMGYDMGYRPMFNGMSAPQFQPPAAAPDAAFEEAFSAAEANLASMQRSAPNVANVETVGVDERIAGGQTASEASELAAKIVQEVTDKSSPELLEKMKNSQFMTLMNKLRTNEISLDEADARFVDGNQREIDAHDIRPDSTHDWPPQRQTAEPVMHPAEPTRFEPAEQPPLARPVMPAVHVHDTHTQAPQTGETSQSESQSEGARRERIGTAAANGLPELDDPDTYFQNMRQHLEPQHLEPQLSSFKEAQILSDLPLKMSDWEETYEDWN